MRQDPIAQLLAFSFALVILVVVLIVNVIILLGIFKFIVSIRAASVSGAPATLARLNASFDVGAPSTPTGLAGWLSLLAFVSGTRLGVASWASQEARFLEAFVPVLVSPSLLGVAAFSLVAGTWLGRGSEACF